MALERGADMIKADDTVKSFCKRLEAICQVRNEQDLRDLLTEMIEYRETSGFGGDCMVLNKIIEAVNGFLWTLHIGKIRKG